MLKICKNPYVAFSGGKDSTVLLHLVSSQKSDIWVRHWDYGPWLLPRWIETEILDNLSTIAPEIKLDYQMRPGGDKESARHSNVHASGFFVELEKAIKLRGWDMCFLGIRSKESRKRRQKVERSKSRGWDVNLGRACYPVGSWSATDIWSYIISNQLPYPTIYDKLARLYGYDNTRLSTFFDDEIAHIGSLEISNLLLWRDKKVE